jgi:predicted nucleic acid-binding protein
VKIYLDTSALVCSISDEAGNIEVRAFLDRLQDEGYTFVTTVITEVELRRTVQKLGIPQSAVSDVLENVHLIPVDRPIILRAGLVGVPKGLEYLRSLDAIHVATAEYVQPHFAITYDKKQAKAFEDVGVAVET